MITAFFPFLSAYNTAKSLETWAHFSWRAWERLFRLIFGAHVGDIEFSGMGGTDCEHVHPIIYVFLVEYGKL